MEVDTLDRIISSPAFVFALIIVLIFYIPLFVIAWSNAKTRMARRDFYRAIMAILERNADDEKCVPEIFIAYKKLIESHPSIKNSDRSAVDSVEDLIYRVDSSIPKNFKDIFDIEISQENRKRIINITVLMKKSDPFASVSSKYSGLLNMLNHALNTSNQDLGKSMLNQLTDDVELLERTIYSQQRTNTASIIVSIVGVVLTIIFGFISIVPLFQPK